MSCEAIFFTAFVVKFFVLPAAAYYLPGGES